MTDRLGETDANDASAIVSADSLTTAVSEAPQVSSLSDNSTESAQVMPAALEPPAGALDVAGASALDVASLRALHESREAGDRSWSGESVSFGSAPSPASAPEASEPEADDAPVAALPFTLDAQSATLPDDAPEPSTLALADAQWADEPPAPGAVGNDQERIDIDARIDSGFAEDALERTAIEAGHVEADDWDAFAEGTTAGAVQASGDHSAAESTSPVSEVDRSFDTPEAAAYPVALRSDLQTALVVRDETEDEGARATIDERPTAVLLQTSAGPSLDQSDMDEAGGANTADITLACEPSPSMGDAETLALQDDATLAFDARDGELLVESATASAAAHEPLHDSTPLTIPVVDSQSPRETSPADRVTPIGGPALLDAELAGFHLLPGESIAPPPPIPGIEALGGPGEDGPGEGVLVPTAAGQTGDDDQSGVEHGLEASVDAPVLGASAASRAVAQSGSTMEADDAPRGAMEATQRLVQGDADLQDFVARSEAQAHVLATLEMVARRVRGGEIVPHLNAGCSPEAVLASLLASLLSPRT